MLQCERLYLEIFRTGVPATNRRYTFLQATFKMTGRTATAFAVRPTLILNTTTSTLSLVIEDVMLLTLRLYYEPFKITAKQSIAESLALNRKRYRSLPPPPVPLIIAARPQIGHKAAQQPIQKRQPALKLSGTMRRSRYRRCRCFPMKLH
jgi:hypothetical protein